MPIETNFAQETLVYHHPIPCTFARMCTLEVLKPPHLTLRHLGGELHIRSNRPHVLLFQEGPFTAYLGQLIHAAGQPWWDFCLLVEDNRAYAAMHSPQTVIPPHAHALSLLRVHANGHASYLHAESPEDFAFVAGAPPL